MARAFSVFRFNLLLLLNVIVVVSAGRRLQEDFKVKGVNLGGWLVVERWIKPSLFDDIVDKDLLDGTQVQFRSLSLGKYVSAEDGGGQNVVVNRNSSSGWETFKLWRVSDGKYQFKVFNGQFIKAENGGGGQVTATTTTSPSTWETFTIIRHPEQLYRVHIKALNGMYLQAVSQDKLTADYREDPGWESNAATFNMNIIGSGLGGDFQLANGYGPEKAKEKYDIHRQQFVTEDDFKFLAGHGINTVRIPVGWWIKDDPNPPPPFIGGSLAALDNAFRWSRTHNLKVIVDLHAAPGSQNGMEHSASRDGSADWANSSKYISKSLEVIDYLAYRYSNNPALLGIELLNAPLETVPIEVLSSYYAQGYKTVRKHTSTAYVILCQRGGNANPRELFHINGISSRAVVDIHYYNVFNEFNGKSAQQNIDYIVNKRQPEVVSLSANGGPLVFVGEWTNEWKGEGGASKKDYQRFGDAQLQAYGQASFGWAFWTLKNAHDYNHWDFEWNIQNQYLNRGLK